MLLSVILYKERLFADASYYFFQVANKGWFHVEHGRIVLALSQVLPVMGALFSLPLKLLMVLSSLGHELFYYGLFLGLLYIRKDKPAALLLLSIHLIGQLWLYYSPMYEICYGAALTVLFYSLLSKADRSRDLHWIFMLLVQWFAMRSHLENMVLVLFVLAYDYLENSWRKYIHFSSLLLFVLALVTELLTLSEYEQQNLSIPFDKDASWLHLLDASYLSKLGAFFGNYFPDLLFFSALAVVVMLWRKEVLKTILFVGACLVLLVAINNKANAVVFIRYFESMYNPLVFLGVFILVKEVLTKEKGKLMQWGSLALVLLLAFRLFWIWDFGKPLRDRMAQLERIVDYSQELGGKRFILEKANVAKPYSYLNWAVPIETFLISAIDGKERAVSIVSNEDIDFDRSRAKLKNDNFLFRRAEVWPLEDLNPRYFSLGEGSYEALNTSRGIAQYQDLKSKVKLLPEALSVLEAADSTLVRLRIQVKEGAVLGSSLKEQVFLSYHWLKDGKVVDWDGMRTAIELDVFTSFSQDVWVRSPKEPGNYEIQFDIVLEGKDWFGLEEKTPVVIRQ
jgi:hypothetical protein